MAHELELATSRRGLAAVVRVGGTFDLHGADRFDREIRRILHGLTKEILVDLRDVEFMDSIALRCLVAAHRRAFEAEVPLWIVRGGAPVAAPGDRPEPAAERAIEPPVRAARRPAGGATAGAAFVQLAATLRELRGYRQAALMLVAFLIYNDGIGTIIRMAGLYGAELGLPESALIGAIVMVQFVGIPFAFLFGQLAGRIGAKRAILLSLVVLGGMGSLLGALIGALVLSVVAAYVSSFYGPTWSPVTFYLALFLILLIRPQGLFGKRAEL